MSKTNKAKLSQMIDKKGRYYYPLTIPDGIFINRFNETLGKGLGLLKGTAEGSFILADVEVAMEERPKATGRHSFAAGQPTMGTSSLLVPQAIGTGSLAWGTNVKAKGVYSYAFGVDNISNGIASFTFNKDNTTEGTYSAAFGEKNIAKSRSSFVVGDNNKTEGVSAFASGSGNTAGDDYSAVFGLGNMSAVEHQVVFGRYNVAADAVRVTGYGVDNEHRSNIEMLDEHGNLWISGYFIQNKVPTRDNHLTTKSYVDALFNTIKVFRIVIVDVLPPVGEVGKMYLVPIRRTGDTAYDEYIWYENAWKKIGSTAVDLVDYYTKEEVDRLKQNKLTAGESISIQEVADKTVISAPGLNGRITTIENDLTPMMISWTTTPENALYHVGESASIMFKIKVERGTPYEDITKACIYTNNGDKITLSADNEYIKTGITSYYEFNIQATSPTGAKVSNFESVRFGYFFYYGRIPASGWVANEVNVKNLPLNGGGSGKLLNEKDTLAAMFDLVDNKVAFAYPKAYGPLSSIKDVNGFEYLDAYEIKEVPITEYSITNTYYVYILKKETTIINGIQVFIF